VSFVRDEGGSGFEFGERGRLEALSCGVGTGEREEDEE
jgi:hypothetical protein